MMCGLCGDGGIVVIGDRGSVCECEAGGRVCPDCLRPNDDATPFRRCRACQAEADAEWAEMVADR